MLTRLRVRNFKTLEDIDIPLGQNVVLIGPNNSGKTSALQALALWRSGITAWRQGAGLTAPSYFAINRKDLTHTPVPNSAMLWNRQVHASKSANGLSTDVLIQIAVDGETNGRSWHSSLVFQLGNSESILCIPSDQTDDMRHPPPTYIIEAGIAFLAPMSGLALEEPELQPGRMSVLIGEGQTAQVLRNLCLLVAEKSPQRWRSIVEDVQRVFGVELRSPQRDSARGTIELAYGEKGVEFDLSGAGRGMQQTLLLLAHIYANPGSTLLLDEPDAHLEILRQRQIYSLVIETARRMGSQVIAASHSEVLLNEAADRDVVVAFVGKPHRIDDRGVQVLKSLREIGFEQYYQAEQCGFVLYLEGSTDLAILRAFARKLGHPAQSMLEAPFVKYVANQPKQAVHHFYGLREAKRDLRGFAVFDRLERGVPPDVALPFVEWRRREIENYLCTPETLMAYAKGMEPDDLVGRALRAERCDKMSAAISKIEGALRTLGKDAWSPDTKVSDEFLKPLFETYFSSLQGDDRLNKSNYHELAEYVPLDQIDPDVISCLDRLVQARMGSVQQSFGD